MSILFTATVFLGAFLLFLIEPMFAKMALPMLGGAPAVWVTAMLFYQVVLVGGYAYAHFIGSKIGLKRAVPIHVGLLVLAVTFVPIRLGFGAPSEASASPTLWLLAAMAASVGLPFFALSATSPLLQRWFASSGHRAASSPYFLYAAGNLGSLLALLAYPLFIEPRVSVGLQSTVWGIGYLTLAALLAVCGLAVRRTHGTEGQGRFTIDDLRLTIEGTEGQRDERTESAPSANRQPSSANPQSAIRNPQSEIPIALSWRRRLRWIALAAVPSSLMMGVTTFVTTQITVTPVFWVLPLALYLLTFVIVFANRPAIPHRWASVLGPLALAALVWVMAVPIKNPGWLPILAHPVAFFFIALVLHGELAADRPSPARLTEYFLLMSIGGAIGGAFNAVLAPTLFVGLWEYPIALAAAALLFPWRRTLPRAAAEPEISGESLGNAGKMPALRSAAAQESQTTVEQSGNAGKMSAIRSAAARLSTWKPWALDAFAPILACFAVAGAILLEREHGLTSSAASTKMLLAAGALLALLWAKRPTRFAAATAGLLIVGAWQHRDPRVTLHTARSFFGVHRVVRQPDGHTYALLHGQIVHGMQDRSPGNARKPLAYYFPTGPVGDVFTNLRPPNARVAVIGLGAGALAGWSRPGEDWTFFEIDPEVARIAQNPKLFTFLRDSPATTRVILGDGRLALAARPAKYDIIFLDAFSSGGIPEHLLTKEALLDYRSHLMPGGLMVFNITNQHVNLEPLLAAQAEQIGMGCVVRRDDPAKGAARREGKCASTWAVLAPRSRLAAANLAEQGWIAATTSERVAAWTDDHSSILAVLEHL